MKKKRDHLLEYLMTVEEIQREARKYDRRVRWQKRWAWFGKLTMTVKGLFVVRRAHHDKANS